MSALKPEAVRVGPSDELSLRVSVATLSRVIFYHPDTDNQMLALEHKATSISGEAKSTVVVQAQPFGGAVRIANLEQLADTINGFRFDSERSRSEQDFRIFIRPSSWKALIDFCLQSRYQENPQDLESDPTRELTEEFLDTLGILLSPDQFTCTQLGIVVENQPSPTSNVRAAGASTARVYWTYEAEILDPDLCQAMLVNSEEHPAHVLREMVLEESSAGGKGRANAILATSLQEIHAAYQAVPSEVREGPLQFRGTILAGNVPAVLEGVVTQKYTILK